MSGVKSRVCTRLFCVLRVRKAQNVCDVPKMRFLDCFPATFSGTLPLKKRICTRNQNLVYYIYSN